MEIVYQLLANKILIASGLSWLIAQLIKMVIHGIKSHSFNPKILLGQGGMPSAHSATVTAIAISCGLDNGFSSAAFAIAFILALVVMNDAMCVRLETEKQTRILKSLIKPEDYEILQKEHLKTSVGHTPLQVVFGCIIGIIIPILCYL
ncbi:MAG: divergent PAP2 family protein [Lachnospiraceae bacterium]|nr:divergent PAP2 family protein [Lachnospiraceae bacterium]